MYQIHFETNQLKDYKNGQNVSIFEDVLAESEGLTNFFYEELMGMAKTFKKGIENNILAGISTCNFENVKKGLLVAVTEKRTKEEMDEFIKRAGEFNG